MMFENVLLWLLDRLYPKKDEPMQPAVAVNVTQKQTVKKATTRTVKRTPAKTVAAKKTVAKKATKVAKKVK
jgi:hypothetical protein